MALIDRIAKSSNGMYGSKSQPSEMFVIPGAEQNIPKPNAFGEIGVSGVLRTRGVGYIYEEWLLDLATYRQKQIYREMRDNDAVIGALFFALEMILRKAEWHVEQADGDKGGKYAKFIEECMQDCSHTWEDFIAECVNMFAFGFALFETVYKRRLGPNGKSTSKYKDGLIGWRKHAPRAQESILYWIWDDAGGLQGAVQLSAPDYHTVPIPIEKLLLFRTTSIKNSPEGRSLLRNCYRTWFFKRRIEEIEGIGIERDLCGIPVLYCTAEALAAMGGQAEAVKLVTNIRIDDQAGVVLPLAYDEKGNQLVKLELMKAAGAKQTNAGETISRYNSDLLNTVLAGFVQFGQSPTGSRALHMSATQIFSLAITAYMDGIAGVMNRIAIPRLMKLNKFSVELSPKIIPGEIGVRDLDELSTFIQQLAQSGLSFIDPPTQDYLRKIARLPEIPKDDDGKPVNPAQDPNNPGASDPQAILQTLQTQLQSGTITLQMIQHILSSAKGSTPNPAKANGMPPKPPNGKTTGAPDPQQSPQQQSAKPNSAPDPQAAPKPPKP
jgi:hypothetical protein